MIVPSWWRLTLRRPAALVAGLTILVGLLTDPNRLAAVLLLWSWLILGLGLMGCLTIAVQYAHRSPAAPRLLRLGEELTGCLLPGAIGLLAALLLGPGLWPGAELTEPGFKTLWLQRGGHLGRSVVYLLLWLALARALVGVSRARRARDDAATLARHARLAALFFYVFGLTLTLAGLDWLMALEPHWYSTIFGLYQFAGLGLAGLAALTLGYLAEPAGRTPATRAVRHDLGQLLLTFACLWVYLWFSQFLLIWYTGIPEETTHYIARLTGEWRPLFYVNLALNGVIPFFVLLPRPAKQSPVVLRRLAGLLLLGRWLDLHLHILPATGPDAAVLTLLDLGALAAAALWLAARWRAEG